MKKKEDSSGETKKAFILQNKIQLLNMVNKEWKKKMKESDRISKANHITRVSKEPSADIEEISNFFYCHAIMFMLIFLVRCLSQDNVRDIEMEW